MAEDSYVSGDAAIAAAQALAADDAPVHAQPQPQPAEEQTTDEHGRDQTEYATWSNAQLVARVLALEAELRVLALEAELRAHVSSAPPAAAAAAAAAATVTTTITTPTPKSTPPKPPRAFDASRYATRIIALKFAYLGAGYNGFEHHANNKTPLPTVEEALWRGLRKCRMIFPTVGEEAGEGKEVGSAAGVGTVGTGEVEQVSWEGVEYSKCGRTDRGVSAFGQVVGLRVRSARRAKTVKIVKKEEVGIIKGAAGEGTSEVSREESSTQPEEEEQEEEEDDDTFDPIADELPYINMLNRVLPPTIRALAWCAAPPPHFSARFSCKEREYRYFFTNPAFLPIPSSSATDEGAQDRNHSGMLDIEAMREAAAYLEGTNDFRNLCKIDASKQLTEFKRHISEATVVRVAEFDSPAVPYKPTSSSSSAIRTPAPAVYALKFRGSAFLWHQVRCMAAVLFLVGRGLEHPTIVRDLLDVTKMPSRPVYDMASDRPLVLWDCRFSATAGVVADKEGAERPLWDRGSGACELDWIYEGESATSAGGAGATAGGKSVGKWGRGNIMEDLWSSWRGAKMDEILAAQLMDHVAGSGGDRAVAVEPMSVEQRARNPNIFTGEDSAPGRGKYVPLMQRKRLDAPEVINQRWRERKGVPGRDGVM